MQFYRKQFLAENLEEEASDDKVGVCGGSFDSNRTTDANSTFRFLGDIRKLSDGEVAGITVAYFFVATMALLFVLCCGDNWRKSKEQVP